MRYSNYTDQELFVLMQQDDAGAFTELYNRYWKSLYYTAQSILNNSEACRDIIQEVFTSFWQRRAEVVIEFPKTYLKQAVKFQVFKVIQAEKTDQAFYGRLAYISADIVVENPLLCKEMEQLVKDLMAGLPEDARRAFMLNREEKLTYDQIAQRMDISVKTVEKKMSLALRHFRKGLTEAFSILFILS